MANRKFAIVPNVPTDAEQRAAWAAWVAESRRADRDGRWPDQLDTPWPGSEAVLDDLHSLWARMRHLAGLPTPALPPKPVRDPGIPERYADPDAAPKWLRDADEWDRGLEWASQAASDDPPSRGLRFAGPTGTGKTGLAAAIARLLADRGDGRVMFARAGLLVSGEMRDRKAGHQRGAWQSALGVRVLVLDDLGEESSTDWGRELVSELVTTRHAHERLVVVTTNLDQHALAHRYGDRVASRIREMTERVAMTGSDRREAA